MIILAQVRIADTWISAISFIWCVFSVNICYVAREMLKDGWRTCWEWRDHQYMALSDLHRSPSPTQTSNCSTSRRRFLLRSAVHYYCLLLLVILTYLFVISELKHLVAHSPTGIHNCGWGGGQQLADHFLYVSGCGSHKCKWDRSKADEHLIMFWCESVMVTVRL